MWNVFKVWKKNKMPFLLCFIYSLFLLIMLGAIRMSSCKHYREPEMFYKQEQPRSVVSLFSQRKRWSDNFLLFELAFTCQALLCPHYPIHIEGERWWPWITEATRIHTIRAWVCVYLVFTAQIPLPVRPVCWSVDCLRSPEWELWTPIQIGAQWKSQAAMQFLLTHPFLLECDCTVS